MGSLNDPMDIIGLKFLSCYVSGSGSVGQCSAICRKGLQLRNGLQSRLFVDGQAASRYL